MTENPAALPAGTGQLETDLYKQSSTTLCGRPAIVREWQAAAAQRIHVPRKTDGNPAWHLQTSQSSSDPQQAAAGSTAPTPSSSSAAPCPAAQEARLTLRLRKLGVPTPLIYLLQGPRNSSSSSSSSSRGCIWVQDLQCPSLQQRLQEGDTDEAAALLGALGELVARMHDGGVVHGALLPQHLLVGGAPQQQQQLDSGSKGVSTAEAESNKQQQQQVPGGKPQLVVSYLGMAVNSTMPRDKAQDLVTLEEGLEATAPGRKLFECFMATYRVKSKQWSATFNRLAEVRKRHYGSSTAPGSKEGEAARPPAKKQKMEQQQSKEQQNQELLLLEQQKSKEQQQQGAPPQVAVAEAPADKQ